MAIRLRCVAAGLTAAMAAFSSGRAYSASFTVLYTFPGPYAETPTSNLAADKTGALYGITELGGAEGVGSIFRFDPHKKSYETLYSFNAGPNGYFPVTGLVLAPGGAMFGAAGSGGANNLGLIYRFDVGTHTVTTVYNFIDNGIDGTAPAAPMIVGPHHILYGTTTAGGGAGPCDGGGCGTVFAFDPSSGTMTTLHAFSGGSDGLSPDGALILNSDGLIYGVTSSGGANGYGEIYAIDPVKKTFAVVYSFLENTGPNSPSGSLVADKAGTLYGTTFSGAQSYYGSIFSFNPATQALQVLHAFNPSTEGDLPRGLARTASGKLCGGADDGPSEYGTIFCLNPRTSAMIIVPINPSLDGYGPNLLLAKGKDTIYGTMSSQGPGSDAQGTIFKFIP